MEFQGIEWLQKRGHLAETKMSGLLTRARPAGWSWRPRVAPDGASLRCALPCGRFGLAGAAAIGRLAGMRMDTQLQKHYALLLGIGSPWEVPAVELKLAEKKVAIELGWQWELPPSVLSAGGPVRSMTARRNGRGGTW